MKYPNFAEAVDALVRRHGRRRVMELLDASDRSMTAYLAGHYLPRADKLFAIPELAAAAQRDVRPVSFPELSAA